MHIDRVQIQVLPDGRLNAHNAAKYLGLSTKTLAMMRCEGDGPPFIKRGRIFYFMEDLDAWIAKAGRTISTAQARTERHLRSNPSNIIDKVTEL